MRRKFVLLLALFCLALSGLYLPARAMETNNKKGAAPANMLDMPFLVAPANKGDSLIGFHYISYRLVAPTSADIADIRNKVAIIQDAYVRDVYKNAVGIADDQSKLDPHALHYRMIVIARRIAGAKKVSDIIFMDMKFSPIHPKPGGGLFVSSTGNEKTGGLAAGQPSGAGNSSGNTNHSASHAQ